MRNNVSTVIPAISFATYYPHLGEPPKWRLLVASGHYFLLIIYISCCIWMVPYDWEGNMVTAYGIQDNQKQQTISGYNLRRGKIYSVCGWRNELTFVSWLRWGTCSVLVWQCRGWHRNDIDYLSCAPSAAAYLQITSRSQIIKHFWWYGWLLFGAKLKSLLHENNEIELEFCFLYFHPIIRKVICILIRKKVYWL